MLHSINVDHDNDVFMFFIDGRTGITIKLTPEEAIKIGEIGELASLRKQVAYYEAQEEKNAEGSDHGEPGLADSEGVPDLAGSEEA
jgi:hypothetical protein